MRYLKTVTCLFFLLLSSCLQKASGPVSVSDVNNKFHGKRIATVPAVVEIKKPVSKPKRSIQGQSKGVAKATLVKPKAQARAKLSSEQEKLEDYKELLKEVEALLDEYEKKGAGTVEEIPDPLLKEGLPN